MTSTTPQHERAWILKAKQGDDDAFTLLVEAYQSPVYNLCYRMLGEAQEAEDAAQETFLKAFRNLRRYDLDRRFLNWILSIASNHCIDRLRKRRWKLVSIEALISMPVSREDEPGPERHLAQKQEEQRLHSLLMNLRPVDRAAVIMHYWYDYSYEEIAEVLSVSIPALKSRLHRARRELAAQWMEREMTLV
ncbi:MAG TPA: sigma-70 family RNA polymerase sigma factor, partial [Chloroflexi bacterium]|nr:sigma-70 family RNA polymerase sigma factor [Chloroflexota bacterium]